MALEEGIKAPAIELKDQDGQTHKLDDYQGKPVVLYFYPKDDTPGCTTEACNFRDDYQAYQDLGAVVLGVSKDSVRSHADFRSKYDLPFPLLADEDGETVQDYDVWHQKSMFGKDYMGIVRTTYLIDGQGKIAKTFAEVDPKTHSEEVLRALSELQDKE